MDTIFIHDLRIEARIGVYDWERHLPQTIRLRDAYTLEPFGNPIAEQSASSTQHLSGFRFSPHASNKNMLKTTDFTCPSSNRIVSAARALSRSICSALTRAAQGPHDHEAHRARDHDAHSEQPPSIGAVCGGAVRRPEPRRPLSQNFPLARLGSGEAAECEQQH